MRGDVDHDAVVRLSGRHLLRDARCTRHRMRRASRIADCAGSAHDLTVVPVRPFRRAHAPRRLVAILAALVVALTSLPGAALCVGSDGHFAVEPIGSDCGTPTHADEASLHGCTDTPLGTATLQGQNDPGRRELCTPALVTVAAAAADPRRDETRVPPDAPRTGAFATRSTVLLL